MEKASQAYSAALLPSELSQLGYHPAHCRALAGSLSRHLWLFTLLLKGYFYFLYFPPCLLKLFPIWVPVWFKLLLETSLLLWFFLLLRGIFLELPIPLVFLKAWKFSAVACQLAKQPALTLQKTKNKKTQKNQLPYRVHFLNKIPIFKRHFSFSFWSALNQKR